MKNNLSFTETKMTIEKVHSKRQIIYKSKLPEGDIVMFVMTGSEAGILMWEMVVLMFSTSTILKSRFEASLSSTSRTMSFHLNKKFFNF